MCDHLISFIYDIKEGNTLTYNAVQEYPDLFLFGGVLDPGENESEIEEEFLRIDKNVSMWNELHPALH